MEVKQILRNFIANFNSSPTGEDSLISTEYYISIFSRRHDRLIVNEDDLAAFLRKRFRLEVKFVRNEDLTFAQQVPILRKTILAIGMHGSLLVMGMFMPPGALLIEMYPFAVPAANYTPYNSMCKLPGMNLAYESWTNTHQEANTSFPDRIAHYGGIKHLPPDEQEKIINTHTVPEHLCCSNPYWLFRIFQDTRVNLQEIEQKVIQGLQKSLALIQQAIDDKASIMPASVTGAMCLFDKRARKITLTWNMPWNSVSGDGTYFTVWSHVHYREFKTQEPGIEIVDCDPVKEHAFWVKAGVKGGLMGGYSKKISCE
jgi:protein O-mannose beta-1,4-N-acetylglucosaminyltransferase